MHGAGGGAKPGRAHSNWRHRERSQEAIELRKLINALGREARDLAEAMDPPDRRGKKESKGDI